MILQQTLERLKKGLMTLDDYLDDVKGKKSILTLSDMQDILIASKVVSEGNQYKRSSNIQEFLVRKFTPMLEGRLPNKGFVDSIVKNVIEYAQIDSQDSVIGKVSVEITEDNRYIRVNNGNRNPVFFMEEETKTRYVKNRVDVISHTFGRTLYDGKESPSYREEEYQAYTLRQMGEQEDKALREIIGVFIYGKKAELSKLGYSDKKIDELIKQFIQSYSFNISIAEKVDNSLREDGIEETDRVYHKEWKERYNRLTLEMEIEPVIRKRRDMLVMMEERYPELMTTERSIIQTEKEIFVPVGTNGYDIYSNEKGNITQIMWSEPITLVAEREQVELEQVRGE